MNFSCVYGCGYKFLMKICSLITGWTSNLYKYCNNSIFLKNFWFILSLVYCRNGKDQALAELAKLSSNKTYIVSSAQHTTNHITIDFISSGKKQMTSSVQATSQPVQSTQAASQSISSNQDVSHSTSSSQAEPQPKSFKKLVVWR